MTNLSNQLLPNVLGARAEDASDSLAMEFWDGGTIISQLTYGQLYLRAQTLALALRPRAGVGGPVLLLYEPSLEYACALFATMYAGMIAVPMYPLSVGSRQRAAERLTAVADKCSPSVLMTTAKVASDIASLVESSTPLRNATVLLTDQITTSSVTPQNPGNFSPQSGAILQFTSGATASPKGVLISQTNIAANSVAIREKFEIQAADSALSWLPPYHDMGLIGGIIQPIFSGIPVTLMSPLAFLRNPRVWLEAMTQMGRTISGGPNFAYDLCLRAFKNTGSSLDLSGWRLAFNGSERIRAGTMTAFVRRFAEAGFPRNAFYPCYGLAENTLMVSGGIADREPHIGQFDREILMEGRAVSRRSPPANSTTELVGCGTAIDGHQIRIIAGRPEKAPLGEGQVGEICVTGPSVMSGYWNADLRFNETYVEVDDTMYLRTGDLGFLADGELFVLDRLKDTIVVNGQNFYTADIEEAANRSDDRIRQGYVAAFSVPDLRLPRESVVIFAEVGGKVARNDDAVCDIEDKIRTAVSSVYRLPIADVVVVPPGLIPKTASGKFRRRSLRAAYIRSQSELLSTGDYGREDREL